MITKEQFITLIKEHEEQSKRLDKLSEAGFSIFDTDVIEYGFKCFDAIVHINFNEFGQDWIYAWLYEFDDKAKVFAWEKDGTEIYARTPEELWNLVEEYRV